MTLIDQDRDGITLRKEFAWVILTAIIGGGYWVGSTVAATQAAVAAQGEMMRAETNALRGALVEVQQAKGSIDSRVRSLEAQRASDAATAVALRQAVDDMKVELRTLNELLRSRVPQDPRR